jgi:hypothetical protein
MKKNLLIFTVIAATAFVVTGCNKESGGAPDAAKDTTTPAAPAAAASVDTSKLTAAVSSAEPALKSAVDIAVTAIKKADYSNALTQLQALAGKYKLTDEQKAAFADAIAGVQQKVLADQASKAVGHAIKAATNATQELPK